MPENVEMNVEAPKTSIDWVQLDLEVGRLFSAAPLSPDGFQGLGLREILYPGRASEVRLMMSAVRDPAKHILLFGERGLGKTSLSNTFWQSSNTVRNPILTARVQAEPFDSFSSLWSRALVEFQAATLHYDVSIRSDFEQVTPDIVRREFQKLPPRLLFTMVVDEFDLLQEQEARELTANLLKALHDRAINVTIILIGVAENVRELIINHQSLRRVLTLVKLERMNIIDLGKILDNRLQLTPLKFSDEARSEIVTISCGLPYYVQILGKSASQNAVKQHRTLVEIEDMNAAIENFLLESGQSFADDYQRAADSRQVDNISHKVLLASALAHADTGGFFRPSEVVSILNLIVPGNDYHHARVHRYLSQFILDKRAKILIRAGAKGDYRYRFSDALMQPFIVMRAIKDITIDHRLRHRLFHFGQEQLRDGGYRLGVAEANAAQLGMIMPTITDTKGEGGA
jgi:GTPase SAR1 family protein